MQQPFFLGTHTDTGTSRVDITVEQVRAVDGVVMRIINQ